MPTYKLTYFNVKGRGECIRLLFALSGVEYNDVRISKEEWVALKPKSKFGFLPQLDIDGKPYATSRSLYTYLAREFGYYGKTNLECLEIDEVLSIRDDLSEIVTKFFFHPEDENKEKLKVDLLENQLPKYMGMFEKLLTSNGSGYFVGDRVTLADIACYDFFSQMATHITDAFLTPFPLAKALVKRVGDIKNIKDYVAKRPVTDH